MKLINPDTRWDRQPLTQIIVALLGILWCSFLIYQYLNLPPRMTNQTVLEWCSKLEPDLGFQSYLLLRQQDRVDEDSQYVTFFPEVEEQVYVCVWSKGSDEITLFLTGDILKNGEE